MQKKLCPKCASECPIKSLACRECGHIFDDSVKQRPSKNALICTECGSIGNHKRNIRGHFFIELILWLCFLVPGIIYTTWRVSSAKKNKCKICGGIELIPLNTPRGQKLQLEFH